MKFALGCLLAAALAAPLALAAQGGGFEVASIEPCASASGRGAPESVQSPPPWEHGRLRLGCRSLRSYILLAYICEGRGYCVEGLAVPIEGGDNWVNSARYSIEAEGDPAAPAATAQGPWLRQLLEERFHLKVGFDSRDVPVYNLVPARNGPRLDAAQTYCTGRDPKNPGAPLSAGQPPYCSMDFHMTLDQFAAVLGAELDRPVINRTGIAGERRLQLLFAPLRADDNPTDLPSLATALEQQLGLRLEAGRGPGRFLVIEHAEPPSPN